MSLFTKLISGGIHPAQPSAAQILCTFGPAYYLFLPLAREVTFT